MSREPRGRPTGVDIDLAIHYEPGDVADVSESALSLWTANGST